MPLFKLIMACLMGCAPLAAGETTTSHGVPEPPSPAPTNATQRIAVVRTNPWDRWHNRLSGALVNTFERIDRTERFFGEEHLVEENRSTRLHLGLGVRQDKDEGATLVTEVSLRLELPRWEQRLHLFFDDLIVDDELEGMDSVLDAARESEPDGGVRYFLKHDEKRSLSTAVGARFSDPRQVFGRVRGRIGLPVGLWHLRLRETVTWFSVEGWESRAEVVWTRPLPRHLLFRSDSRMDWDARRPGVTPAQHFTLMHTSGHARGWKLLLAGTWPGTPDPLETSYKTELTYRHRLGREWFFLELSPGVEFRREHEYRAEPYVVVKCEIIFGRDG